MCIGGDIGSTVDITNIGKALRSDIKLFSESNTRWIIEVCKDKKQDFEKLLKKNKASFICIGQTSGKNLVIKDKEEAVIDIDVKVLRDSWRKPIWDIMG